jgi:raffinose/stachyose/melibiose transport system permease protein
MIVASLLVIIPLMIVVLGSFKTATEVTSFNLSLPRQWQLTNYVEIFQKSSMARAFLNSLFITSTSTAACLFLSVLASFVIARRNTRGTNAIFNMFIVGMILPLSIIPTIFLFKYMGIYGSYLNVIVLYTALQLPWSVFLTVGFVKTIPRELDDAAILDGCTTVRLLHRVILPVLTPVVVTNVVIIAMGIWNEFMIPVYFLNLAEKWTLPLMVYHFFGRFARQWNYVYAVLIVNALPIVVLYLWAQKHIVAGMVAGSLKI